MSFKLAIILASLAYASAGYLEPALPYPATPLAYNSFAAPALSYGYGHLNVARPLAYSTPVAAPAVSYNNYGYPSYTAPLAIKTVDIAQPTLKYAPALPYTHHYAPALGYAAPKSVVIAEQTPIAYSAPLLASRPALSYAPALSYNNLKHVLHNSETVALAHPGSIAHAAPLLASHSAIAHAPTQISGYAGSYAHHKNPLVNYAY